MVRATIETTLSEPDVPHATPPQIATSQTPRNGGGGSWVGAEWDALWGRVGTLYYAEKRYQTRKGRDPHSPGLPISSCLLHLH